MTTNNETTEDGVSSTGQGAGGAINLSSRPSSVPETTTNQNVQASGNSDVRHTPNIVEADSQEEQVVSDLVFFVIFYHLIFQQSISDKI